MTVLPVIMPKLGAYTEDVLLSVWLVGEGEQVAPGRAIFELETEKTTAEVESETGGFVHHLVRVGQAVPIGATVALIAETQEEYREVAAAEHVERAAPLVAPRARALAQSRRQGRGSPGRAPYRTVRRARIRDKQDRGNSRVRNWFLCLEGQGGQPCTGCSCSPASQTPANGCGKRACR